MIRKRKQDYVWNTTGSLVYALNSVILLMVVVQILGAEQGGIFSIAYTISQTLMIVGCFEMRVFQVTDRGLYSFPEYFQSRICTSCIMIIIAVVWILVSRFDLEKSTITIMLCLYRLSDSFGDVIEGYFQRTDRLYISGRLLTIRVGLPMIIFILFLLCTNNLLLSCFVLMLSSLCLLIVFDFGLLVIKDKMNVFGGNFNNAIRLLIACIPFFLSSFLATYITNAPKYAIDRYLTDELQTYYSVIFMPSFAINLLSGFAFKPLLVDLTLIWEKHDTQRMMSIIFKMSIWVIAITILGVICGYGSGIPILSLIYGLSDLNSYKRILIIILIGGGINAYNIVLYYFLTIMREQKFILSGYIFVLFESTALSNILVKKMSIHGAAVSYLICGLSLGLIFVYKIIWNIKIMEGRT